MVYSLPIKLLSPSLAAKQEKKKKKKMDLSWMVFKLYKFLCLSRVTEDFMLLDLGFLCVAHTH